MPRCSGAASPACRRLSSTLASMRTPRSSPRIVVIGSSCAGKTTFARSLAEARACSRIELDELFWNPGWTPKPTSEFLHLVAQAAGPEAWVADGNYSICRDTLWPRATTIVWLNYSLPRVLWRGFCRTVKRTMHGEVLYHGNRESIRRSFFSKESILVWIITTYHRRRREFAALRAAGTFGHLEWLEVRQPHEASKLLSLLKNAG
jgi:adenylate kinase family enzyme